ncbi:ricin-type beta-trefoil lectin domain protein [Streptomyces sp. NPDC101249]|uniref:ricin-type beta-trefoil lectin domain protein n=1 Tax=Streptomyces sp. NPDC101249 TaxID=3366140 RepID=UPI00381E07F6
MQPPHPPRPSRPPRPGPPFGESDLQLVARRAAGPAGAAAQASALLLARHWRAAQDYAVICMASTEASASMVAAAAFHRVLDRPADGAFRPQLLAAVRDMVKQWAADESISGALPELRKPTGGRGLRIARAATSERRQLAERAFQGLPAVSQCLLWHTEVEAEPLSVPAGLSGIDEATAAFGLEQAREQFRSACVRAHRELAPTTACRFHNRLLDVPIRRGGPLPADVRQHLAECRYCRHAAEQLSHVDDALGVLLAETVLGWGAHRYLAARPGRGGTPPGPPRRPRGGRHRPAAPRRSRRALAVGVGAVSLALLATVLVARSWGDDGGVPHPHATWGAPSGASLAPSPSPDGSPSAASADRTPMEVGRGRLRNPSAGLCLNAAAAGRAELARCSSSPAQGWSYLDDGLLRTAADPTRCLVSDPVRRTVTVADCAVHPGQARYDLTVRGELLLRAGQERLVAAGRGPAVVVARRDGSTGQRWVLEGAARNPGSTERNRDTGDEESRGTREKEPGGDPRERARESAAPEKTDRPPTDRRPHGAPPGPRRYVQVGGGGAEGPGTPPGGPTMLARDAVNAALTTPADMQEPGNPGPDRDDR